MKKLILLLFMLSSAVAYSQNPIWCVAPNYIDMDDGDVSQALPQPVPPPGLSLEEEEFYYYHGQSATAASNAQADAQGNLLFMIRCMMGKGI